MKIQISVNSVILKLQCLPLFNGAPAERLKPTFMPDLDGARRLNPLPVLEPLSWHVFNRDLAHKHSILVFLDVQVFEAVLDQQLTLCRQKRTNLHQSWEEHSDCAVCSLLPNGKLLYFLLYFTLLCFTCVYSK